MPLKKNYDTHNPAQSLRSEQLRRLVLQLPILADKIDRTAATDHPFLPSYLQEFKQLMERSTRLLALISRTSQHDCPNFGKPSKEIPDHDCIPNADGLSVDDTNPIARRTPSQSRAARAG